MYLPKNELRVGRIIEVSGTRVKVELPNNFTYLSKTYGGIVYSVGNVGSIVKIHNGRKVIFGVVMMLRMTSTVVDQKIKSRLNGDETRIMEIQLIAEGNWSSKKTSLSFYRGVKTSPLPQQDVYLLTREETSLLYQASEEINGASSESLVPFATYSSDEMTTCRANINKMFGMHCAVLGATGSGKSATVAALLHSVLEHKVENKKLSPRVVIIDPHGEYHSAFESRAICYRAYNDNSQDLKQEAISLPYWLMSAEDFSSLIIGRSGDNATIQRKMVTKAITHARMVAANLIKPAPAYFLEANMDPKKNSIHEPSLIEGRNKEELLKFDKDKPRPFCLDEFENHIRYIQGAQLNNSIHVSISPTELNNSPIPQLIDKLRIIKADNRLAFIMENWSASGVTQTLAKVLNQFVGNSPDTQKNIRIVNISGLSDEVAGPLTATISRLLFQYKMSQTPKEKLSDPILLVCEEAHRYIPNYGEAQYANAQNAIRTIVKEGRKCGLGLMLVSQRPSDVDGTIISQCGTWLVLRITNNSDQDHVAKLLPDRLSGMVEALPVLTQQEAIFVGEGAAFPSKIKIRNLPKDKLPSSATIAFAEGWSKPQLTIGDLDSISQRMTT
ncbi:hypothetical protein OC5_05690 [Vibrio cyclitrophicus ZF264]|uniref:ATP-binding protein n=1 Tax=Vibrio cyclitrophicus TaxID=47951 RepID=UPI0003119DF4|nr:ATP-binding protein [Vibrio cyclitrophicus]OEE09799.1 hypothetical protein OC5_05690 [Vibrio cyclitrophicus ZF264]